MLETDTWSMKTHQNIAMVSQKMQSFILLKKETRFLVDLPAGRFKKRLAITFLENGETEEITIECQCMKQIINMNEWSIKTHQNIAMVSQKMQYFILLRKKWVSHDISF